MGSSYVYKRQRLQNSIALLSPVKEAKLSDLLDCCNSTLGSNFHPLIHSEGQVNGEKEYHPEHQTGEQRVSLNVHLDDAHCKHLSRERLEVFGDGYAKPKYTSKSEAVEISLKYKEKRASGSYGNHNHVVTSDNNVSVNDSCSTSRSHSEQYLSLSKAEAEEMGECSSSDVIVLEPPSIFRSSRDLCIHVLRANASNKDSDEPDSNVLASANVLGGIDADADFPCKTCGQIGNSKNMLICDLCDEAFHVSCCHEKAPFREEWYCLPCSRNNPRPLLDAVMGKSFNSISEEYKRRILEKELGPIQFMLKDTQPYMSRVRIGKDFQAEIPELVAPTTDYSASHDEPIPLSPAECSHLNGLNISRSSRLDSIGNWLQCKEVIYVNKHDDGVLCGKWRRAPLFAVQTDDWDCSCAIVWDPIHGDCAVPQEIPTDEVLKQLKFVEMVRTRLGKRQACGQTKNDIRW